MSKEDVGGSDDNKQRDEVKVASKRGIVINYFSQFGKFGLQFIFNVWMARLLIPSDFGIVAMAAPVLAFGALWTDLGLSQAVIQKQEITQKQLSMLFWINMAVTLVVCGVLAAAAGPIAHFYNEPEVAAVILALSGLMFFSASAIQHRALLNRELAFGRLSIIDLVTFTVGATAGVIAAWRGFGLWSLVINQAVNTVLTVLMLWVMMPWRPGLPSGDFKGVRGLVRFGADIAVANIANFSVRNLDNVMIGKVWGDQLLGQYDRAYKLLLMPITQVMFPINKVARPLLSRVQGDTAAYCKSYFAMLEMAVLIIYPGTIFAFVTHDQLVRVVLGPQWSGAADIFAVLAIAALFAPIAHSTGWLLISQGRTKEMRNFSLVSSVGFVAAMAAGLPWGAIGVAYGHVLFGAVQGPITWALTVRYGQVTPRSFWGALAPYVLAGIPLGAILYGLQAILPQGLLTLVGLLGLSYVIFVAGLFVQPSSRRTLQFLAREASSMAFGRLKAQRTSGQMDE
jgi:PST family polysaccharide transporter